MNQLAQPQGSVHAPSALVLLCFAKAVASTWNAPLLSTWQIMELHLKWSIRYKVHK